MEIHAGETIAIIGPSGSGKSTLLNIIGTLDTLTAGKVLFDGTDIAQLPEDALFKIRNQRLGFVFQMHHLLPQLNLLENVLVPLIPVGDKGRQKKSAERAMDLLSQMGLADKIHQFPGQLSVGECQRTAVVRALINEPEIILADEPTGSLDHDSAGQLCDILLHIRKTYSVAMVVVTHSTELAQRMDSAYKLTNGKLIQA